MQCPISTSAQKKLTSASTTVTGSVHHVDLAHTKSREQYPPSYFLAFVCREWLNADSLTPRLEKGMEQTRGESLLILVCVSRPDGPRHPSKTPLVVPEFPERKSHESASLARAGPVDRGCKQGHDSSPREVIGWFRCRDV